MSTNWRLLGCVGLAAVVVVGCSQAGESPTSPTRQMALGASGALAALADPGASTFAMAGADTSTGQRGPCEFNQATGQFDCPNLTRDGITLTRRFTLYDAAGAVLSVFDRARVASVKTETTVTGTTVRNGATVTINRHGVMVVSGLGPGAVTHTVNGSEQGTIVSTASAPDGTSVTTNTTIDHATTNLVVPVRQGRDDRAYPLSGVRVYTTVTTTSRGTESRTVTTRREETFDGTNIVQVVLTINGVTERCTFDLATRRSTCAGAR